MTEVKRPYRQTRRAEKRAETRRRIIESAVELYGSIGPAVISMTEVAKRAGVSRPTLYANFAHEVELFQACTAHWLANDPLPHSESWWEISEPRDRVEVALTELYSHHEGNENITSSVLRDIDLVQDAFAAMAEILTDGFLDEPDEVRLRRRAAVTVAISFPTWRLLVRDAGLTTPEAIDLMTDMVVRSP